MKKKEPTKNRPSRKEVLDKKFARPVDLDFEQAVSELDEALDRLDAIEERLALTKGEP